MVRKPKAKQDPKTGKWLRNGARAKAGLTSAILRSSWGRIAIQLGYKAQRAGALVLKVPAVAEHAIEDLQSKTCLAWTAS